MMERFITEVTPVIANRDSITLQSLIDIFGREASERKHELIVGTIEYVVEDLPYLEISTKEPTDPLFIAIEDYIRREFEELFLGMMRTVAGTMTKLIEQEGWRF